MDRWKSTASQVDGVDIGERKSDCNDGEKIIDKKEENTVFSTNRKVKEQQVIGSRDRSDSAKDEKQGSGKLDKVRKKKRLH